MQDSFASVFFLVIDRKKLVDSVKNVRKRKMAERF